MTVQPEVTKYTLAVFFQLRKKEKQGDLDDAQEVMLKCFLKNYFRFGHLGFLAAILD